MREQHSSIPHLDQAGEQMKKKNVSVSGQPQKSSERLSAGDISLDFVNTMHPDGYLANAADLICWSRDVGLIPEKGAQILLERAEANLEESRSIFKQAMALREASYRALLALIYEMAPAPSDIWGLQDLFLQARVHAGLISADHRLAWQWEPAEVGLAQLTWLFSRSSEALLTSASMQRVKECPPAQGGCGWLFIDKSKNSSRQWCSDETCGSRIRMRRLYARKRGNKES